MATLALRADAFEEGAAIPVLHTPMGLDLSPALHWSGIPDGTRELSMIMDDPDAPMGTFTHWLWWGMTPNSSGLEEGQEPPLVGASDFGLTTYRGPCPPIGGGVHRYQFQLYALGRSVRLGVGASRKALDSEIKDSVLDLVTLVGTFER